jgi:class 3 adenylate cyclase
LLALVLPVFIRLELTTLDERVRQVRGLRGTTAPSASIVMLGLTETTRDKLPDWGVKEERETYRLAKEAARGLWVDPNLGWTLVPADLRTEPLPFRLDFDETLRRVELANEQRISPALKLYAQNKGVPPESIQVDSSHIQVGDERLSRWLVVDFPPHVTEKRRETTSDQFLEPRSMHLLFAGSDAAALGRRERLVKRFNDSLVLLVDHTQEARSRVDTPMGDLESHQITFSVLDTLLSGWRLKELPLAFSIVLSLLLSMSAAWWAVRNTSFIVSVLTWAAFSYLYWTGSVYLYAWGYSIPVMPVVAGTLISIALVAAVFQVRAFRMMKQLVGEDRAADAARGEIDLGGQLRTVTILFTNLPQEIQALERVDPEESIRARNRYGETLTRSVRHNGGRILDYQGDYQMAGFCVEKVDPDHAINAVKAGLELCKSLGEQYPDENICCGVCTGPAAVGYVGAPSSKELAAIGDTSNVAARLLGAAGKQGVSVLVSSTTYDLCAEDLVAEKLPAVSLKGKTSVVEVYSVEATK